MLSFFFFNDTATTEIYTLSLHDALPISIGSTTFCVIRSMPVWRTDASTIFVLWTRFQSFPLLQVRNSESRSSPATEGDRKSTRLNSSHTVISYAVFCLKKKKKQLRLHRSRREKLRMFRTYKEMIKFNISIHALRQTPSSVQCQRMINIYQVTKMVHSHS